MLVSSLSVPTNAPYKEKGLLWACGFEVFSGPAFEWYHGRNVWRETSTHLDKEVKKIESGAKGSGSSQ